MTSFLVLLLGSLAVIQHVHAAPAAGECPRGDVVFIIDKSGSIGADWPLQIEALKTIVGDFPVGPAAYQFGAVSFETVSYEEFQLDTYNSTQAVKTATENIVYTAGYTNIAAGFREARHMFEKSGNRPLINDIAILFTDGSANRDIHRTDIEAELLKAEGVLLITVGISPAHDQAALSRYATDPSWYFSSPGYDTLAGILNDVSNSVCEAVDTPSTICQMCNDFDTENYGYLAHDECYKYYLCRHDVTSGSVDLFATMKCGPGTVFNLASAKEGKPCVAVSEENPNCPREDDVIPQYEGPCLYVPDPYGEGEFGVLDGDHFTKAGTCGGGHWDVEHCTCIGMLTDCRCRLMVDFEGDVQDHSCNRGWISNNNPQVTLVSDGIFGGSGHFTGLTETYQNGAHLLAWSLNGAFNPCEHGGQDKLTVATWMKYSGGNGGKGLVNYCGEEGPSFYLSLDADTGRVTGGIETYEGVTQTVSSTSTVSKGEWYYISMVYDSANISLYVTRKDNFLTCAVGSTASYCLPEDVKPQTGCVKSKNCGVQIGASGKSWEDDEFFQGHIDDVQIFFGANYMACRG